MRFHKLTHPEYVTDQESAKANPIEPINDIWLPGIVCGGCGETWAGSKRSYILIADSSLRRRLTGGPLPERDWSKLAQEVRQAAGLPESYEPRPGELLGAPRAILRAAPTFDILHPFPGQIVVNERVMDALERAKLTGFRQVTLEVKWGRRMASSPERPPALYELLITGRAWRKGMNLEKITACHQCGRRAFPDPWMMEVDEERWDGSDFFNVDLNPNIALVTERVCETLRQGRFTNWACVPTDQS